ncbi:MAG: hypothetical protein Q8N26_33445 [Myxococcales bacterium]|nr:hypothetical protein [Myxococcales bacterium]
MKNVARNQAASVINSTVWVDATATQTNARFHGVCRRHRYRAVQHHTHGLLAACVIDTRCRFELASRHHLIKSVCVVHARCRFERALASRGFDGAIVTALIKSRSALSTSTATRRITVEHRSIVSLPPKSAV